MTSGIAPAIGLTANSPWVYGPKISRERPSTANMVQYLEGVKYTSFDLSSMEFQQQVPEYTPSYLSPRIPTISAEFQAPQLHVVTPNASISSATSILMQKAAAITAYAGR